MNANNTFEDSDCHFFNKDKVSTLDETMQRLVLKVFGKDVGAYILAEREKAKQENQS